MLLRKYMSLLGIGAAKIDLKLQSAFYRPGETVKGHFYIEGGTIEQQLKRIECDLVRSDDQAQKEETIETYTLYTSKTIDSEEINQMDFYFTLPSQLESTTKERRYRFKTKMVFDAGVKSEDQDEITIM